MSFAVIHTCQFVVLSCLQISSNTKQHRASIVSFNFVLCFFFICPFMHFSAANFLLQMITSMPVTWPSHYRSNEDGVHGCSPCAGNATAHSQFRWNGTVSWWMCSTSDDSRFYPNSKAVSTVFTSPSKEAPLLNLRSLYCNYVRPQHRSGCSSSLSCAKDWMQTLMTAVINLLSNDEASCNINSDCLLMTWQP